MDQLIKNRWLIFNALWVAALCGACNPVGLAPPADTPTPLSRADERPIAGYDLTLVSMAEVELPNKLAKSNIGNPQSYEEFGKRYEVLNSSEGFREKGIASWYGIDFHGRATSSGEIYDMYQITAAHKTLPLPTYVRVNNLDNGRTLVVKVNDRGPFIEGRIIDLSYAAAYRLGVTGPGTATVEILALSPAATGPVK